MAARHVVTFAVCEPASGDRWTLLLTSAHFRFTAFFTDEDLDVVVRAIMERSRPPEQAASGVAEEEDGA